MNTQAFSLLQETLARTKVTPINAKHIKGKILFVIHFAKMGKMVNVFTWGNPYNNFIRYITQSSMALCASQKKQIPLMYFRWNPNVRLGLGSMGSSLVNLHLICFLCSLFEQRNSRHFRWLPEFQAMVSTYFRGQFSHRNSPICHLHLKLKICHWDSWQCHQMQKINRNIKWNIKY